MPSSDSLSPPPSLAELKQSRSLALFLDFDGTLVEIAPDPDAISVPDDLAENLQGLRDRLEGRLALVSGRALDNLAAHLGQCWVARAGSHGVHCLRADGTSVGAEPLSLSEEVVQALRDFAQCEGLRYETKSHGGALHYRSRPEVRAEVHAFAEALADRHGLWVKQGKAVVELVHPGADKARAVRAFMDEAPFAGATPIFIGDDVTDEDGFAGVREFGGFGIAVGNRASELARYRLTSVAAVHNWLGI